MVFGTKSCRLIQISVEYRYIWQHAFLFKSIDRLFLGPRTGGNKIALEGPWGPPSGVRSHKRASLISVDGTIAYVNGFMGIQLLPFESHRADGS